MSFMGGGACAAGANPLAQIVKQQDMDRSLQHDRMQSGAGPSSLRDGREMSQQDGQLLRGMGQHQYPNFQFEEMQRELASIRGATPTIAGSRPVQPGPSSSAWAADFKRERESGSQWGTEFQTSQVASPSVGPSPSTAFPQSRLPPAMNFATGFAPRSYAPMHQQQPSEQRIVQLDDATWEEQFRSVEQAHSKEAGAADATEAGTAGAETQEVDIEEALDERELGVEDGVDPRWFEGQQYPPGWDDVWERIKGEVTDDSPGIYTRGGDIWDRDFDHFATSRPQFADYKFAENNPYLQEDDPFALGVALMDNGAKLSLAVLCFEAALQRDRQRVEVWNRLGGAQAQNELEDEAIRALEQCVKLDPQNETALLNLSISYINEGYENAAYATLERWLATKYPDLVSKATNAEPNLANENKLELHSRVTQLFLKAAQLSPDGANMDADVQVGLGVLFYGNEEYTKAVDCFQTALSVRPDDPLLWNRLGATLANSNRPEEAIDAYYKALELRPSFVRARYNVGVSCINIGCYREAAEHLLSAMSLHQTSPDGPNFEKSTNLAETLRRVFLALDRRDLVPKVGPRMDLDQFRSEFTF